MPKAEPVYKGKNILGEGPVWHTARNELIWTDIVSNRVWSFSPESGETAETALSCYVACMGVTTTGSLVAASGLGWVLWDGIGNHLEPVMPESFDPALVRFNDGKTGPDGALWAGTMDLNASKPVAALYRLSTDRKGVFTVEEKETGLIISNGIGWSPDGRYMYLTDTGKGVIYRYEFDSDTGSLANRIDFLRDTERPGVPDGLAVDAEGRIWSARWDGSQVVCYESNGSYLKSVEVPALRPTSCCFGGKNLDILYITSARYGIPEGDLTENDGALFAYDPGVPGTEVTLYPV